MPAGVRIKAGTKLFSFLLLMVQDYSDYVKVIKDVGTSRTIQDVLSSQLDGTVVNLDPGLVYSNGYRYSYLRNRVANVGRCNIAYPNGVKYEYVLTCTTAGAQTISFTAPKTPVTTAYAGNAAVLSQV